MFQNVIWGWLSRRGIELGGIAAAALSWYMTRTPAEQDAINRVFTGDWREVPIGVYIGIGATIWGYVWSFRATTAPQVVTADAHKIPLPRKGEEGVSTTRKVETLANAAPAPKTLWERLTGRN